MFRFTLPFALTLLAAPALAFTTTQGARVEARGQGSFEVLAQPGLSAPQAFCAAGLYAVEVLNLDPQARLWRASPTPRRAGQGVTFTLSPEGAAPKSGLFSFGGEDGGAVTVAHARGLCYGQRKFD